MKIIRFIKGGKVIQLGFEGKILYIKWGLVPNPMKLGELKDIKALAKQRDVSLNGKEVKVPFIIKQMAKSITPSGLILARNYTDQEFYEDFLKDYKEMDKEGQLKFVGEFTEWV